MQLVQITAKARYIIGLPVVAEQLVSRRLFTHRLAQATRGQVTEKIISDVGLFREEHQLNQPGTPQNQKVPGLSHSLSGPPIQEQA